MTRRDFPGPGDGGAHQRPRTAGWRIVYGAWVAVALAGVVAICQAWGR